MQNSSPDGYFPGVLSKNERYTNPFYGVPFTFLPLNLDQMLWWADHFLLRFGFYRAALMRISNYFITELSIECDDEQSKAAYKEILEDLCWKEVLSMAGLNLLAYGNVFCTVCQGFQRFLVCPKCQKVSHIDKVIKYSFSGEGKYSMICKKCSYKGVHEVMDKPSRDTDDVNMIFWSPREIRLRYEETTAKAEYFWDYPNEYKQKVCKPDNTFYSKRTPQVIYDAIFAKKLLSFNPNNFLHLKLPTPSGVKTDGRAVPPCIYMFDDFFMLQVLRRFNEVICFEDINPFRVFSMANGENSQANPILNQSSKVWSGAIDDMITEHRLDPGAYHRFPFALNYQQLGGEGNKLAPVEMINAAVQNILNALNIPQELYTMNFQHRNSVGPALRLFENSWSCLVDNYNRLLNHWGEVIGKIKNLADAKIGLIQVSISDDMERKSIVSQLVSANAIAKSEMLSLYGFDFKEQIRKKMQEDKDQQDIQKEEQEKEQIAASSQASVFGQQQQGQGGQQSYSTQGSTPGDILAQAQEIAQRLEPMDGAQRRQELQTIKAQSGDLYAQVKIQLEQITAQRRKQGVQQGKQQAQQ